MGSRRFVRSVRGVLAVFALAVSASGARAATDVVYSFAGDEDGEYPSTELVLDGAGNLYGTSVQGGEVGGGTVFQLTLAHSNRGRPSLPLRRSLAS